MRQFRKFSIGRAVDKIKKPWSPVKLASANGQELIVAVFEGEYKWHSHEHDELFIVQEGSVIIETERGNVMLGEGEGFVVPKGISHRPSSEHAVVLIVAA
ncbi:cupin domain-containing protein [Candidatus Woesearchaeota archaeon]|nr:cupin domain-containing protein [Candidatus Woesearchaeota archaeon]